MPPENAALPPRALRYGLGTSEAWAGLLKHFVFGEGFAFIPLTVPDQYGAEVCQEALGAWLAQRELELVVVPTITLVDFYNVPDELLTLRTSDRTGAVWIAAAVTGSYREYNQWRQAWEQIVFKMNRIRDTVAERIRCPLLLVGAPWAREVCRDLAPDLWSIRTPIAEIKPVTVTEPASAAQAEPALSKTPPTFDPDYALGQAARLRGRKGSEAGLAELLIRAAGGLEQQERFSEAIAALEEAVAVAPGTLRRLEALVDLGILEHRLNRFRDATAHLEQARSLITPDLHALSSGLKLEAILLRTLAVTYHATQRMIEAERNYQAALAILRNLGKANSEAHSPNVATTLNNLANLYRDTQRIREAEEAYLEALAIRRDLAKANQEAYLPSVAGTLNNLGNLYSDTQRMKEAEDAYQEALATYRDLTQANPEAYLPHVATTLNNMAILYRATQRMKEAEEAYQEALAIRRGLAQANPEAYLPNVARTLHNMTVLYDNTQRREEAGRASAEAQEILEPLWQRNPEAHGDQMARIWWTAGNLLPPEQAPKAIDLYRHALDAAYDPSLREQIQNRINELSK